MNPPLPPSRPITVSIGRATPEAMPGQGPPLHADPVAQTPPIDIHEGPDGLVLEADLPGVSDQEVNIQLEANVLELTALVPAPDVERLQPLHEEFRLPGVYHRSFILSDEVDRTQISAELRNGVLRLSLPKAERARSRRIEIRNS